MYSYQPAAGKWAKVKRGISATEAQQQFLIYLGWGRENVTKFAATVLIQSILDG